jgi:DNA-binding NarL/FixJ family response regulator
MSVPTVLIVDDHPTFRASARALLEAEGFEVVGEAEDATGAVDAATRLRPDVVLLDVQLPGLDGFAAAQLICAALGRCPKVVLVSSRDAADYGGKIEECGAAGFIPKAELCGPALADLLP